MKPWYLYNAEDERLLYEEEFDLEAVLCSADEHEPEIKETLEFPTSQVLASVEESSELHTCVGQDLVQPSTSPEESVLVKKLQQELELVRAQFKQQVHVNESLNLQLEQHKQLHKEKDLKIAQVQISLEKAEKQLQDKDRECKETRFLYNSAIQTTISLKQQLWNSELNKKKEQDLSFKADRVSLQKKEKELEDQYQANKEIRFLYNSAVQSNVQLKQELANSSRSLEKVKVKLSEQNMEISELKKVQCSCAEKHRCSSGDTTATEQKETDASTQRTFGSITLKKNEDLPRKVQDLFFELWESRDDVSRLNKEVEDLEQELSHKESKKQPARVIVQNNNPRQRR